MSEEHASLIGFDPLAWMREEEAVVAAPTPAPAATLPTVQPAAQPEPATEPAEAQAEAEAEADDGAAQEPAAPVEPVEEGVVALGEVLDIAHVGGLYEQLTEALRQGRRPAIDAAGLERVDAAGMQLLVAYGRELDGLGGQLEWRGMPAEALREAAGLLGLGETLGLAA